MSSIIRINSQDYSRFIPPQKDEQPIEKDEKTLGNIFIDWLDPKSHLGRTAGREVLKLFPCSTQLSTKFILLINVKMPMIVGILTFVSRINTSYVSLKARNSYLFFSSLVFMSS